MVALDWGWLVERGQKGSLPECNVQVWLCSQTRTGGTTTPPHPQPSTLPRRHALAGVTLYTLAHRHSGVANPGPRRPQIHPKLCCYGLDPLLAGSSASEEGSQRPKEVTSAPCPAPWTLLGIDVHLRDSGPKQDARVEEDWRC